MNTEHYSEKGGNPVTHIFVIIETNKINCTFALLYIACWEWKKEKERKIKPAPYLNIIIICCFVCIEALIH